MTISIKLDPTIFDPGGLFEGIPRNRAVLHMGTARNDLYIGKINQGTAANLSYRGGQTNVQIDYRGTDLTDEAFEFFAQKQLYQSSYLSHLVDLMDRGLVQVFQDGIELTIAQVKIFTA